MYGFIKNRYHNSTLTMMFKIVYYTLEIYAQENTTTLKTLKNFWPPNNPEKY